MHSANNNNNNNDLLVIHPQSGSSLTKMLSVHSAKMYIRHHFHHGQLYNLCKDVLWLKYLFFTSFRLSVYSLQRADYNESDARFTIT